MSDLKKKKIVFVRIWPSPPMATSVQKMLMESFPEYQVETIDIVALIKKNLWVLVVNCLYTLKEYGWNILRGKNHFKVYFYGTTFLFHWVRSALTKMLLARQDELAFTFQLQSMFDASLSGTPHFVYTDHTVLAALDYPDTDPGSLFSPAWVELEKSLYRNATRIFTWSQNIKCSLTRQYGCPPTQVTCVYTGANMDLSCGELANDNYSNQNILFVGIDWQRKGGPVLVQAFERLVNIYPQATLTIVGANPQLSQPGIRVVGLIPVDQVDEYYRRASIFCMPTQSEPFGTVFVEALARRLPVVGTNIGAIPDFVSEGETGYLVQPGDVDRLVDALSSLLASPEKCREFGEQGRRLAETRYNYKTVGQVLRAQILPLIHQ